MTPSSRQGSMLYVSRAKPQPLPPPGSARPALSHYWLSTSARTRMTFLLLELTMCLDRSLGGFNYFLTRLFTSSSWPFSNLSLTHLLPCSPMQTWSSWSDELYRLGNYVQLVAGAVELGTGSLLCIAIHSDNWVSKETSLVGRRLLVLPRTYSLAVKLTIVKIS